MNRHHVETAGTRQPVTRHIVLRQLDDSATLDDAHGFRRVPERNSARLHLDEHQGVAVPGNDVQFATSAAVTPGENFVPPSLEFAAREIFPGFA